MNKIIAGQYEVIDSLGRGGFGEVYKVRHQEVGMEYALKIIHHEKAQDPQFQERFRREAVIIQQLVHPNSVFLRDFGHTEEGGLYMVMDYCPGRSLQEIVNEGGAQSPQKVLHWVLQILDVLVIAHEQGVIHRDLKPENILISEEDGEEVVKVLDFGIAKIADEVEGRPVTLTKTGMVMGSPMYMSPEQALGDPVDHRSDLYSLGLIAYYLLSGLNPYSPVNAVELLMLQVHEMPPPFEEDQVPDALAAAIFRTLAKERDERYPSAVAMMEDLEQVQEELFPPVVSTTEVRWQVVPLGIFLGLVLMVLVWVSQSLWMRDSAPRKPPVIKSENQPDSPGKNPSPPEDQKPSLSKADRLMAQAEKARQEKKFSLARALAIESLNLKADEKTTAFLGELERDEEREKLWKWGVKKMREHRYEDVYKRLEKEPPALVPGKLQWMLAYCNMYRYIQKSWTVVSAENKFTTPERRHLYLNNSRFPLLDGLFTRDNLERAEKGLGKLPSEDQKIIDDFTHLSREESNRWRKYLKDFPSVNNPDGKKSWKFVIQWSGGHHLKFMDALYYYLDWGIREYNIDKKKEAGGE